MKSATKIMLRMRTENERRIKQIEDKNRELTRRICKIEGDCPLCLNTHYPHCQPRKDSFCEVNGVLGPSSICGYIGVNETGKCEHRKGEA